MSYETFDKGMYRVKVTRWGLTKARTGNTQFVISFKPIGFIDPSYPQGEYGPCSDHERSIFCVITDKTIDRVVSDLRHLGYEQDNFDGLNPLDPAAHNFEGLEFDAECFFENYQGQQKEKWQFGWGGGGMEIKPLESNEIKKLNALFGKKFKSDNKSDKRAPVASKKQNAPIGEEEDIPF